MSKNTIKEAKISDLIPDDINANKHTQFGLSLVEKSLQSHGFGRSILVDKHNRIIAGNGVCETAGSVGMENCLIIETTGDQLVVVKRTDIDLDSKRGRELAIADNASAKASISWDEDALIQIVNGFDIDLEKWGLNEFMPEKEKKPTGGEKQYEGVIMITFKDENKAHEMYQELETRGYSPFLKEE